METAFPLEPIKALDNTSYGLERAMVELLILHSFHHGASRLEFRTIGGEFRVAQIIEGKAREYPQPPGCIRQPTIDYLRTIFCVFDSSCEAERLLAVGEFTASARCKIFAEDFNAIVTITGQFAPSADLLAIMQRFFRACAVKQGKMAFVKHLAYSVAWGLEDWVSQSRRW